MIVLDYNSQNKINIHTDINWKKINGREEQLQLTKYRRNEENTKLQLGEHINNESQQGPPMMLKLVGKKKKQDI